MREFTCFTLGAIVGAALLFGVSRNHVQQPSVHATATQPQSTSDLKLFTASANAAPRPSKPVVAAKVRQSTDSPPDDGKLRIIAFGAHPDDCEIRTGGSGAKWADLGHHVKFVSATNGDIGHWGQAGGPLAIRRTEEVMRADRLLGVSTRVLDIHDGELMPTLENRRKFTEEIRRWDADVVLSHRPNDYHPDHRYTGVLVQDSAFMVAVPFFCPETAPLKKNPVFLYYDDRFEKPYPFTPDLVVSIDDVIERKVDALLIMKSQFYEGGALGNAKLVPDDAAGQEKRRQQVRNSFRSRFARIANKFRPKLVELYGEAAGNKIQYAEAFEVCEYGRQPSKSELLKLFPFFPKQ